MLHIERMRMQLPAGFEHRASTIARLIGNSIAGINPAEERTLDKLSIGPVQISPGATDEEIANKVARQIASALGATT